MLSEQFIRGLKLDWSKAERSSYLHEILAIRNLKELTFTKPITFFVGENGTGKSTLLEAIAVAYGFNPEGGSKNFCFSTKETHSSLYKGVTLIKGFRRPKDGFFLRAESFYNVASQAEEYGRDDPEVFFKRYGGKSLHDQSHGESFLALMQNRFGPDGMYLLDEPEAALSPQRQLSLLLSMWELAHQGAQFLIASHSPILLGIPGAEILSFDEGEIRSISYTETESYQVMEMFINSREYLLKRLLGETRQTEEERK